MNPVAEKLGEPGLPSPVSELAGRDWDAVVVGGGHNGLAAAAYLARAGQSVLVLERRERVGGAATLERPFSDERYVVSPCAYVRDSSTRWSSPSSGSPVAASRSGSPIRRSSSRSTTARRSSTGPMRRGPWPACGSSGISDADIQGYNDYNERFDRCRRLLRKGARDTWVGTPRRGSRSRSCWAASRS